VGGESFCETYNSGVSVVFCEHLWEFLKSARRLGFGVTVFTCLASKLLGLVNLGVAKLNIDILSLNRRILSEKVEVKSSS
jgi:hypothetical protein